MHACTHTYTNTHKYKHTHTNRQIGTHSALLQIQRSHVSSRKVGVQLLFLFLETWALKMKEGQSLAFPVHILTSIFSRKGFSYSLAGTSPSECGLTNYLTIFKGLNFHTQVIVQHLWFFADTWCSCAISCLLLYIAVWRLIVKNGHVKISTIIKLLRIPWFTWCPLSVCVPLYLW